jgi:hypothetical protein
MADLAVDLRTERLGVQKRLRRDAAKSIGLTAAELRPMKAAQIGQANRADPIVVPLPPDGRDNLGVDLRRTIV